MKQHFTQSKASRNLNLRQLAGITSEQARRLLCEVRWADNGGRPVCPHCGCNQCLVFRTREIYRCRECRRQFSATSGTLFHSRNLSVAQYLFVIAKFAIKAKGTAANDIARECGHDPSSMFVLLHKLREAMASEMADRILHGEVETDGCYIGKYKRPANQLKNRQRFNKNKYPSRNKKCIGVIRERNGPAIVQVNKRETQLLHFIRKRVDPRATLYTDDAPGWNVLGNTFKTKIVAHKYCYCEEDGTNTNQAESFFSRVRRSEEGIYHHISSNRYAQLYAEEIAWRENNSRLGDAQRFIKLLSLAMKHPVSQKMSGYWQRGRRGK